MGVNLPETSDTMSVVLPTLASPATMIEMLRLEGGRARREEDEEGGSSRSEDWWLLLCEEPPPVPAPPRLADEAEVVDELRSMEGREEGQKNLKFF